MSGRKGTTMNEQELSVYETAVEIVARKARSAQSAKRDAREERKARRDREEKSNASA